MRIRKNAAKLLLGSIAAVASSLYSSEPLPSPSTNSFEASAAAAAAAGEIILCELNCSPWDVMTEDDLHNYFSSPLILTTNSKIEEEDGDRGIMGNFVKAKEEQHTTSSLHIPISKKKEVEQEIPENKKRKKMMKTKRNRNKTLLTDDDDNEKSTAEPIVKSDEEIIYCKKTDGKAWRCKRRARTPHYFCSYHIEQARSYSGTISAAVREKHRRTVASDEAATGTNYYYYYSGFGPSQRKRRHKRDASDVKEEAEDEYSSVHCLDDADNDSCCIDCSKEVEENGSMQDGEDKRMTVKRKKKAKTRSLKSLL